MKIFKENTVKKRRKLFEENQGKPEKFLKKERVTKTSWEVERSGEREKERRNLGIEELTSKNKFGKIIQEERKP